MDASWFPWVTETWRAVVPPNHVLLIGLLVVFEAVVGVLILSGGRMTQLGLVSAIPFHCALCVMGRHVVCARDAGRAGAAPAGVATRSWRRDPSPAETPGAGPVVADHLSFFTMSPQLAKAMKDEITKTDKVSGATIHFSADRPLPKTLVEKITSARLEEQSKWSSR